MTLAADDGMDLNGGPVRRAPAGPWLPVWLVRLAAVGWRALVVMALALVLFWLAFTIGVVTASVIVAMLVSAAVAPVVIGLRRRGRSRNVSAALGTLLAVAVVGGVLLVAGWVLVAYGPQLLASLKTGIGDLGDRLSAVGVPPEIRDWASRLIEDARGWILGELGSFAAATATLFTILLFGTFTTFFMLQDGDRGWAWAMQPLGPGRREALTTAGRDALSSVGGYLRTAAALAAVEAVADLGLMLLVGIPMSLAVPLATLVFAGGFIPYLGGLVATVAVLVVALGVIGPDATVVLAVLIGLSLVVEGWWIAPRATASTIRIHPAVILVALPVGAVVAGLFGMIVAVPVAAVILAVTGSVIAALGTEAAAPGETVIVPDWLDLLAQWSWRLLVGIALVAVAVAAVLQVPIILMPVILATVLAATLAPLVTRLRRRGWQPTAAAAVTTVGAFGAIALILALTVAGLLSNVDDIGAQAGSGAGAIGDATVTGITTVLAELVTASTSGIVRAAASAVAAVLGLVVVVVFGACLTFFFLRDAATAWTFVTRPVTGWRKREIDDAAERAVSVLGGYMLGTGAISAFGALTQLVIMAILGIPLALPLAVLSFFGGFIPYIGSLVTTGLALLVTVAVGSTQDVAIMAVYTVVFNIVQGNIVAPLVYSRAVSLHPAIVLLAIPAGSAIAGVIGMFLVVPFLGVLAATWRTVLAVMGDRPPVPEPEPTASDAPPVQATAPLTS